jgi:EAL domain-containing protein (putative c-di-GMP-specific phosphodiesterase class I)
MGHAVLYRDPLLRSERAVHRSMDEAMRMCLAEQRREEESSAAGLAGILADGGVVTLFQPIVDLQDRSVVGHEVFSRGPAGSGLEDPERLFVAAERSGRILDLERLCRRQALLGSGRHLTHGAKLFLNTSTPALHDPELEGKGFLGELERQGLSPGDVVLEIKERVAVEDRPAQRNALRHLKRAGLGIAIDDMGAGYASLQSIVELEPDFLKFDIALVRNIDRSQIKRSLLETVVELSQRIGASVIAEGIEAEAEFRTLKEMGVPLGQGHYLAPPEPVPEERDA